MPGRRKQFEIDRSNIFGRSLICGWFPHLVTGGDDDNGTIISVGQRLPMEMNIIGGGGAFKVVADRYAPIGEALAMRFSPSSNSAFRHYLNTTNDFGFRLPDSEKFTVMSLVRPNGDGTVSSADPRIFSIDQGTAAADHDCMIGIASSGNAIRCRIRHNNFTTTVLLNSSVVDDQLQLISAGLHNATSETDSEVFLHHLSHKGVFKRNASSVESAGYAPRTSTDISIGASAQATSNPFDGDVLCICVFSDAFDDNDGGYARNFMADYMQVFKRRRSNYAPIIVAGRTVAGITQALILNEFPAAINRSRQVNTLTETLTLNELPAAVNRTRLVDSLTEALVLTPASASVNRTRQVAALTEALELSETPAAVNRSRLIDSLTEALVLTPASASVNRTRLVDTLTEAIEVATNPASITRGAGRLVTCVTEALLLATTVAAVNRSRLVDTSTEALTLATNAATINRSRIIAGLTESLLLATTPATVNRSRLVDALTEALEIATNTAVITRGSGRLVTCVTEALLLATNPAVIDTSRIVIGSTEALELTESPAAVNRSRLVDTLTEVLLLTPAGAAVSRSRLVQALTEVLQITTNAATITRGTLQIDQRFVRRVLHLASSSRADPNDNVIGLPSSSDTNRAG